MNIFKPSKSKLVLKRIFDDEYTSSLWKIFYKQKLYSFRNKLIQQSKFVENDCAQISKSSIFLKKY